MEHTAQPPVPRIDADAIERACRAHWPHWEAMRPENREIWREKMARALQAFVAGDVSA